MNPLRLLQTIFCLTVLAVLTAPLAHAQNSLGIGGGEVAIKPGGPFTSVLLWIQQQQQEFYRALTGALKQIRSSEGGFFLLVGLSFGYGVLHAAGPGHGKAVISSYMLANEVQLRRGIGLSFASAALQAIVAIVLIAAFALVLHGLGIRQGEFTRGLEVASYLAITLLGFWLLYRKVFRGNKHLANNVHHPQHYNQDHHGHCEECGHSHMPAPDQLEGKFGIREAWGAIFAVGLRPCTGALVVLTFAFLNDMYLAGILSAFAMAIGTAITVSGFASAAVGSKNLVLKFSGAEATSGRAKWWIEVTGALLILLLGLTLLSASLI